MSALKDVCDYFTRGMGQVVVSPQPALSHHGDLIAWPVLTSTVFSTTEGAGRHQHHPRPQGSDPQLRQRQRLQGLPPFNNPIRGLVLILGEEAFEPLPNVSPQVFFVESICDDPEIIAENIKVGEVKRGSGRVRQDSKRSHSRSTASEAGQSGLRRL